MLGGTRCWPTEDLTLLTTLETAVLGPGRKVFFFKYISAAIGHIQGKKHSTIASYCLSHGIGLPLTVRCAPSIRMIKSHPKNVPLLPCFYPPELRWPSWSVVVCCVLGSLGSLGSVLTYFLIRFYGLCFNFILYQHFGQRLDVF